MRRFTIEKCDDGEEEKKTDSWLPNRHENKKATQSNQNEISMNTKPHIHRALDNNNKSEKRTTTTKLMKYYTYHHHHRTTLNERRAGEKIIKFKNSLKVKRVLAHILLLN